MPTSVFPRVREAREALRAKALKLFEKYESIIDQAVAVGKFEEALEHTRWLLEHMPADDEGNRVIDPSAAKAKVAEGPRGPSVAIGISLGSITDKPKALPQVIELPALPAYDPDSTEG